MTGIDTQKIAYNLEAEGREIVGLMYTNLFSTITPEQFGKLTKEKQRLFNDRIVMLRELDQILIKLTHVATLESITYSNKKETIINVLNSMLWASYQPSHHVNRCLFWVRLYPQQKQTPQVVALIRHLQF